MQKMGYREGSGLGRAGQGISRALKIERTGRNQGLIVNEVEEEKVDVLPIKQGYNISICACS